MLGIIPVSFHSLTIAFHSTQFFGTTKRPGCAAIDSDSALPLLRASLYNDTCLFATAFCLNMYWRGEAFRKKCCMSIGRNHIHCVSSCIFIYPLMFCHLTPMYATVTSFNFYYGHVVRLQTICYTETQFMQYLSALVHSYPHLQCQTLTLSLHILHFHPAL